MDERKRLVELKARYEDLARARSLLKGSDHLGTYRQTDTYFATGERRLKLREIAGRASGQLIYYERGDGRAAKESQVLLYDVLDASILKAMLTRAFGVRVVVRKLRDIYRQDGVQVHLDEVEGLGRFVEFELAVESAAPSIAEGKARLTALQARYAIPEEDLIATSYSDLLAD